MSRLPSLSALAFLIGFLALSSLPGCPKPVVAPPGPDADAATLSDAALDDARPLCVAACKSLANAPCPEADPAHYGLCLRTCEQSQAEGGTVPFEAQCIIDNGNDKVKLRSACNVRCGQK